MLLVAETSGLDASCISAVHSPPATPLPRDTRQLPETLHDCHCFRFLFMRDFILALRVSEPRRHE